MKIKSFKEFCKDKEQQLAEATSKTLVIVDVQPSYASGIHYPIESLMKFASQFPRIEVFYNGEDFGFESEYDIRDWYSENNCSERTQEKMRFFEKNYAFFRDLIDDGVDDEKIIEIGKLLLRTNKYDWRDLVEEELGLEDYNVNSYGFNIPDVLFERNFLTIVY